MFGWGGANRRWLVDWEDRGMKFGLECCSNEVGRFICYYVYDLEAMRFCLIFLKSKGIMVG